MGRREWYIGRGNEGKEREGRERNKGDEKREEWRDVGQGRGVPHHFKDLPPLLYYRNERKRRSTDDAVYKPTHWVDTDIDIVHNLYRTARTEKRCCLPDRGLVCQMSAVARHVLYTHPASQTPIVISRLSRCERDSVDNQSAATLFSSVFVRRCVYCLSCARRDVRVTGETTPVHDWLSSFHSLTCYTLLSLSITFSPFYSELKTCLFRKSYPPP